MKEALEYTREYQKKIPFLAHLKILTEDLGQGTAKLSLPIEAHLTNSMGTVHGGVIMSLLDIALCTAARTLYDPPRSIMTIDLSTQFIGTTTGLLRAEGRVMKAGQSTIFCEGEARDEKGELVAKAIGTFRARNPK